MLPAFIMHLFVVLNVWFISFIVNGLSIVPVRISINGQLYFDVNFSRKISYLFSKIINFTLLQ